MTNLEELYLKAKDAYYNEQPIMTDSEFDELERKLKDLKSNVVTLVGSWDRKAKISHPSPMRSLEKIQADKTTGNAPISEFNKWLLNVLDECNTDSIMVEVGQKLDGNAVNLVYKNGSLTHALSRGDGEHGRDYLSKIDVSQIPQNIPIKECVVEIRCEAVIAKETFAKKYAGTFSNERNYVAGILNSDDCTMEQRSEIDLVPVEYHRIVNGKIVYHNITDIGGWGFKNYDKLFQTYRTFTRSESDSEIKFTILFKDYEDFKYNYSEYRVDGMVLKLNANHRETLGEVEHHPLWALAVKFKPEDCVTEVIGFEMNMGKTGTFTPVALLKPVYLDGSIVSKASAYNYSFISENNLNIGSIVSLVKSGDIIPQIVKVVAPSDEPYDILGNFDCPYCGSELVIVNDKRIQCPNNMCYGKRLQKFINGLSALKLYGFGPAMMEELFSRAEYETFFFVTTPLSIIKETLESLGLTTKVWYNFIDELSKLKEITIEQVIALLSFDGISNEGKTIKEIGKKLSGCIYDFTGLERTVVSGWDEGEENYQQVMNVVKVIENNGIKVVFHEEHSSNVLKLTLTGSPKEFGFSTKADYITHLKENGYIVEEVAIKDCDYLITDDINSNTSKMQNAKKLGKTIKTYGDEL